ncbi:carbohydrate ABC transporter permease [Tropicibacter naphthalenivorans]|uniref:Trehalose transport system permease protein SugA n=1 Tax=Tropicibacter naphthalenivorans TaxID=441103 RepID=A0A0P1GGE8_9RHOB|nr:sugar ABC transporter permease [Tropicibacter naphthalenivorans]CUH80957.1 Trehalose transport system permease protein SugA [Tropicibacter naphthalenivorans]SMC91378.1 multiple sugar transport system permease protein [Tropicibacter naphthalenivorans]
MTSTLFKRERLLGLVPYAFVAVPLAYMTLFVVGQLIQQVWMSFTDTRLMKPTADDFIGLENYQDLLTDDQFYTSFSVTIIYTILTVILGILVGTASALALGRAVGCRHAGLAVYL